MFENTRIEGGDLAVLEVMVLVALLFIFFNIFVVFLQAAKDKEQPEVRPWKGLGPVFLMAGLVCIGSWLAL